MAYLHPDKQVSVRRILVRGKARQELKRPKQSKAPDPSPGLVANLAAEMLARRHSGPGGTSGAITGRAFHAPPIRRGYREYHTGIGTRRYSKTAGTN